MDAADLFEIVVNGSTVCASHLDNSSWTVDLAIKCATHLEAACMHNLSQVHLETWRDGVFGYILRLLFSWGEGRGREPEALYEAFLRPYSGLLWAPSPPSPPSPQPPSFDSAEVWHQVSLGANATSPPARSGHAAVWDPLHKAMLVFGGTDGRWLLSDFWRFNTEAAENSRQLVILQRVGRDKDQSHDLLFFLLTIFLYICIFPSDLPTHPFASDP